MKKLLIINGSPRIGQTKRAIDILLKNIDKEIEYEIINLREEKLAPCKGCAVCLSKGEELCPAKDGLAAIIKKMDEADAILFATPNYSLNIPALLKNFFDRLAFVYHRPRFFRKVFSAIITQGVYGGKTIDKYFKTTAGFWGGAYVPGAVLTLSSAAYNPAAEWTEAEKKQAGKKIFLLNSRLWNSLQKIEGYKPGFFRIFMFRLTRSSHKYAQRKDKDYNHFKEKGWFESDYFCDTKLGPLQKTVGKFGDMLAKMIRK